jgi:hypothetical protein
VDSSAPIHVVPGGDPNARRLLLLSYHFPPGAAVGALRWEKFSRVGAGRGWALDVITASPAALSKIDFSRLENLPPGTRVFGAHPQRTVFSSMDRALSKAVQRLKRRTTSGVSAPIRGTSAERGGAQSDGRLILRTRLQWRLHSASGWKALYGALRQYDEERHWELGAGGIGREVVRAGGYRAIVTAGPPHAVHRAGQRLASEARLPHIVDLRDPWSLTPSLMADIASPAMDLLERRSERRVFAEARLIVANTARLRTAIVDAYPGVADRVITVMNGFDDDNVAVGSSRRRFTIAFAGNIYIDRSPVELFRAAATVIRRRHLGPEDFALAFMGHVHEFGGESLQSLAEREGVGPYLTLRPYGTRSEAHEFLSQAAVLVNLPQGTELSLPSKVFEYMMFDAWLLILTRQETATADVFRARDADVVEPNDVEGIASALDHRFEQFARGERGTPFRYLAPELSRAAQGELLFEAIERVARS